MPITNHYRSVAAASPPAPDVGSDGGRLDGGGTGADVAKDGTATVG
jgi:hypothetical protein